MRNPFRRQAETAAPTLRERAAELRAILPQLQQPEPVAAEPEEAVDWHSPPPGFMASPAIEPESFARIPDGIAIELQRLHAIAQAEFERRTDGKTTGPEAAFIRRDLRLDVLSMAAGRSGQHPTAGGIAHGDGTVSFTDASGVVSRVPMARWVGFVAMQMHSFIQGEIGRQRVAANAFEPADYEAWEKKARRDLRSDAVHTLAFQHVRAFEAAQAFNSGAEPATQEMRERDDAELLALAQTWQSAADLYQQRIDEQHAREIAATVDGWPGPRPEGSEPEWQAWRERCDKWRERTGITAAEAATSDASDALCKIEDQIAGLSAASLAGLKLKARVAQRHDDIEVIWPDGLGAGLVRDVLVLTEAAASRPAAEPIHLVDQVDFTSATMAELLTVRDVAERIGSLVYAHAWSPRCHRGKNAWGAVNHNVAGKLMNSLGDALTAVEAAAETEAKLRKPSDERDSTTRLYMLAQATIDNGDPDEIEAFARELLAHAEAERTRG